MREIQMIRELMTIAVLAMVFSVGLLAHGRPDLYGGLMSKIDAGRYGAVDYECYEHDYTEDM
jgi:hypothetical protein